MSYASFNLRPLSSNSAQLRIKASNEDVLDEETPTKVLGMLWDVNKDTLSFQQRVIPIPDVTTKIEILSIHHGYLIHLVFWVHLQCDRQLSFNRLGKKDMTGIHPCQNMLTLKGDGKDLLETSTVHCKCPLIDFLQKHCYVTKSTYLRRRYQGCLRSGRLPLQWSTVYTSDG